MATQTMVPMISSDVSGPLGAVHLPRLWQKVLLSSKGMLPEDYDECGSGFDQMTLNGLGLDRDETIGYLKTQTPTYPQFEQWVKEHGKKLSPGDIAAHNAAIAGYNHGEATVKAICEAVGIPADGSITDAVTLNKLEDMGEFHTQLTRA
jgi:Domain of unknown function (DUF5069)